MKNEVKRTGSRRAVPDDALKSCPSCNEPRGNRRQGWEPIMTGEQVVGYTCPECPAWHEPIRRLETGGRVRFRVVVDATSTGAAKRKQVTRTLDSLADARQLVEEVRAEVAKHGRFDTHDETVRELVARSIAGRRMARDVSRDGYSGKVAPVLRLIGDVPVRALTHARIDALVTDLYTRGKRGGAPLSPASVRDAIGVLAKALDIAVREGKLTANHARGVELVKTSGAVGTEVEHWPTTGEGADAKCPDLGRFRVIADKDRLAAAWRLSLCGLTRADVLGLRWEDIDVEAKTVSIVRGRVILTDGTVRVDEPKSEQRVRVLPIETFEPGTIALLRALKTRQAAEKLAAGAAYADSGYVVVDELGTELRPPTFSARFKRLCKRAGVPEIRLHALRHTLALLMVAEGIDEEEAAAWLGHSVDVFRARYLPRAGKRIQQQAKIKQVAVARAMHAAS